MSNSTPADASTGASQSGSLVSVIVPFLDVEQFIGEAIASVFEQTYRDWELILVDDGSTDGSRAIVEQYCTSHPDRVRCLEHPGRANRGASASRNLGWRNARGRYVAFLDADDRWLADKLEWQVALMRRHAEIDLVFGATCYWHSWLNDPASPPDVVLTVGGPRDQAVSPPELLSMLYPLGEGTAPSMNSIMVRSVLIDAIGGFEESFPRSFDDQTFLVKAYATSTIFISSKVCDLYRQRRPGSNTGMELIGPEKSDHRIRYYRWLEQYLRSAGFAGLTPWKLLQKRLASLRRDRMRIRLRRWVRPFARPVKRLIPS
jgi:glycosyltransferase involved in cell wall biosynthesis